VQTEARKVDWEKIKRCLAAIDRESHEFLQRALLIGGAAAWFYRVQLRKANDPDFRAASLSPETENRWLTRDLDFTGIFSEEVFAMLPGKVKET
jgi:hypothetical protein